MYVTFERKSWLTSCGLTNYSEPLSEVQFLLMQGSSLANFASVLKCIGLAAHQCPRLLRAPQWWLAGSLLQPDGVCSIKERQNHRVHHHLIHLQGFLLPPLCRHNGIYEKKKKIVFSSFPFRGNFLVNFSRGFSS